MVAAAGVSYEHVFAPWWAYAYRSLGLMSIMIFAWATLGVLLYWQIQKLNSAESDLNTARNELEIIALTDSLTRLANRRCFDAALTKEWSRANRNNSSIAIVLLDIDWFKQYNDSYGHLQGDTCLQQVAEIIRNCINRPGDLAARYGGEEFVILLPETDLTGALTVAEKVRRHVANALIAHSGSPIGHITVSAGVMVTDSPTRDGYLAALQESDELLYSAKTKGRNNVEARSATQK